MSDAAAAGNGDGQGEAQGQDGGGGFDQSALMEQLQGLSSGQEELRAFLASEPWSPQDVAEAEAGDDGLDLSFLNDGAEYGDADPQSIAEQLQSVIDQRINSQAEAIRKEADSRIRDMEVRREADELVAEFPDLADPEIHGPVLELAQQMAEQLGNPALADSPKFWRMAYMMGRAAENANSEGAESPRAAHLEGGSGATPAGPQVDLGDLIVKGGPDGGLGRNVLPF